MDTILMSILVLGGIGIIGAAVLYVVSRRFYVAEDPRIEQIEQVLPGANCGGCGRSGCHDFATACTQASSLDGLNCPVGGATVMAKVAEIVGLAAGAATPMVAVLKCNGTCQFRPQTSTYDGPSSCAVLNTLGAGTTDCAYGCLGCGDCVSVCNFGAITMGEDGLPVVDQDKCTACGACVKACPRRLLELRKKGPRGMRVYVACSNKDKGAAARKACQAACIGCSKCAKECPHEAITIDSNLSYIDFNKCKLCRKCADVCPTHAILAVNFPVKKVVNQEKPATAAPADAASNNQA
ncbi:MAG: RnfABCDGE type electron transport complex subunit B [Muribaculaceae bacterium]|nr:RnfABCDGE type electron transport complex subunit B [Muribaculaceae bacterium]